MLAIAKRDFRAYFSSPIGYVCIAVILALYGIFYWQVLVLGMSSYITNVFSVMFTFCMMVIPIMLVCGNSLSRLLETAKKFTFMMAGLHWPSRRTISISLM